MIPDLVLSSVVCLIAGGIGAYILLVSYYNPIDEYELSPGNSAKALLEAIYSAKREIFISCRSYGLPDQYPFDFDRDLEKAFLSASEKGILVAIAMADDPPEFLKKLAATSALSIHRIEGPPPFSGWIIDNKRTRLYRNYKRSIAPTGRHIECRKLAPGIAPFLKNSVLEVEI